MDSMPPIHKATAMRLLRSQCFVQRVGYHKYDRNAPADLLESVESKIDGGLLG